MKLCKNKLHFYEENLRRCPECHVIQYTESYKKHKKSRQEFVKNNKELVSKRRRDSYQKNKKTRLEYIDKNKESIKEKQKIYRKTNAGKLVSLARKRELIKRKASPKWLTSTQLKEIEEFYVIAKELQWLSDDQLQVDHIVPLQGTNVCGLHVPWNLQILSKEANRKKGNRLLKG